MTECKKERVTSEDVSFSKSSPARLLVLLSICLHHPYYLAVIVLYKFTEGVLGQAWCASSVLLNLCWGQRILDLQK